MKGFFLIVFFLGFALSTKLQNVQVSAMSNIKDKFQVLNQVQDFIGCEAIKKSLIDQECKTEGEKGNNICKQFKKDLETKLDCKDSCQEFYKKYNKEQVTKTQNQVKYYKKNGDKANFQKAAKEVENLKKNEETMIGFSCAADVQGMTNTASEALTPETKEKKEKK